MKRLFTFFLYLFIFSTAAYSNCALPAPPSFKSKEVASCKFGLQWHKVTGAINYTIQYKLISDVNWTVLSNIGNVTSYTITGVAASASYVVKVAAICPNNDAGAYTNPLTVNTPSCSKPVNLAITGITPNSAVITWAASCGESNFTLKYRKFGATTWTTKKNIGTTSYVLTNLDPASVYQVRVQSKCSSSSTSAFTPIMSFTTTNGNVVFSGKNVLLVIIDDARFDSYSANNGPNFFSDTNISRVANEGVNFKLGFPAQSQCAPSRASIVTGVYPHVHGVLNNPQDNISDTITLTTLPEILHNNGYYTGLIGKYHLSKWPQPGYDFWMENHKVDYIDARYNLNGKDKKILGHQTDVLTDSVLGFFDKVPQGKPFFLWLGYRAPHTPYVPRPQDDGLYDNDVMPYPSNPDKYTVNYPEFLYDCHNAPDSAQLVEDYRGYYELLHGVEVDLGKVFHKMDSLGIMDSTLVIFMSDNGYIMGENHLSEKQLAYENSIKIPIFMRYPKLITAGKVVKKQVAMNIDIAPTILDFAGIPDTFGMQGISLLKLYDGKVTRKELFYEFHHQECVPDMRAVRTINCKYIQYHCSDTTEEFYDLNLDKLELTNEIFNPAYADSVELYRDKLAYWRNYYTDYTFDTLYTCSLSNIQQRLVSEGNEPLTLLNVFPNPSHDHFTLHLISAESAPTIIRIVNTIGTAVYEEVLSDASNEITKGIVTENFAPGNYFAIVQHGSHTYEKRFVVQ